MKHYVIPFICFVVICCGEHKTLTEREKLDSIEVGMTMQEVMGIYGLKDTINRSNIAGQDGYELDTLTGEKIIADEGLSPLITVMMSDSTSLFFTKGKLIMKPELTNEEFENDTMVKRLLNTYHP